LIVLDLKSSVHPLYRLVSVQQATTTGTQLRVSYVYDIFNDRVEEDKWKASTGTTVTLRHAFDDQRNIWADVTTTNSLLARYVYGDDTDQIWARAIPSGLTNAGVAWYLMDRQGSVRDLMDSSGTIQDHIDYDGFGNPTNTTVSYADERGYAGGEYDYDTKLEHFGARYYDSVTGRWTSEDQLSFLAGDDNLYRYVQNNSTNAIDPTGFAPEVGGIGIDAPTVQAQTMQQINRDLLAVFKTPETVDAYLRSRGTPYWSWTSEILNNPDHKDKKKLSIVLTVPKPPTTWWQKIVGAGDITLSSFMWGQKISIPGYNGGVIQVIHKKVEVTTTAGVTDTKKSVSVEGFKLTGGVNTHIDLHTYNQDFDPALIESYKLTYDYLLGAGTYDGKDVTKDFVVLEPFHEGTKPTKVVHFTGQWRSYSVTIEVNNAGNDRSKNRKFKGPFDQD
jgi:RHS repeat-associated protein